MSENEFPIDLDKLRAFIRKRAFQAMEPDLVPDDRIYISKRSLEELKALMTTTQKAGEPK